MGLAIAILVTLAVAGSILWIKPSKRDLRITRIRRKAMSLGMRVRLLDDKYRQSTFPWLDDHRGYALYENHKLAGREGREMFVVEVHAETPLHELDVLKLGEAARNVHAFEDELPKEIRAVVIYPSGIGLLWNEQGDEAEVEELDQLMRRLDTQL